VTLKWKPWHQVVRLRDDLRTGDLSLSMFAADLFDVVTGNADAVYQQPDKFFALTYPAGNLKDLTRDVVARLAGTSPRAVRQLELPYGGGKTHALITLYHLVNEPQQLAGIPAAQEFLNYVGGTPPQARVAALTFDKLDVERGMEVQSPGGQKRWLKQPWSALAYQLAGGDGLQRLHADSEPYERSSAPAENLLVQLLALPHRDGLATLVLIDEVLLFAREKIALDPAWRGRLMSFFQVLTQAVTKVDRCALVASLLAADSSKRDRLGKELLRDLHSVFGREREGINTPVSYDDVAEVLRRRLFAAKSPVQRNAWSAHVAAALDGVAELDEASKRERRAAEERFRKSYPFHPDLMEVLSQKWTGLESFQRTRGILRTFALALQEAEKWDESPLIGANVFLAAPGEDRLSVAAQELAGTASSESYEGRQVDWNPILAGELAKARAIQQEVPGLRHRELEQAVLTTFIHSQPIGHKAQARDLFLMVGPTQPDGISLDKALRRWVESSWFLDESAFDKLTGNRPGSAQLPTTWRLGPNPNLRQMHHEAAGRVSAVDIDSRLLDEIQGTKELTAGATAAGAKVHNLPARSSDVSDDPEFHYVVLPPTMASSPGDPHPEAAKYITETTGPDRERVNSNAVVLAAPSVEGVEMARNRVRDYLAWEQVQATLATQKVDDSRRRLLTASINEARKRIGDAIRQAYCIVVTRSRTGEVEAFQVTVGNQALFNTIKNDRRSRIHDTPVSPEALLPGGPYDLWEEKETSRPARHLIDAFAQYYRLPKMLNRQAILNTLKQGCRDGLFLLQLTRPDRSVRSYWREEPEDHILSDPGLELFLPHAEGLGLQSLEPGLLVPGVLPGLWPDSRDDGIGLSDLENYFSGKFVARVPRDGYEEQVCVPHAGRDVLAEAVTDAVRAGKLWLLSGPASILGEEIPSGILTDKARLYPPPQPVSATEILPASLPDAWQTDTTTALAVGAALSHRAGRTLPWKTVRDPIDAALRSRLLETVPDSAPWPCEGSRAAEVRLQIPRTETEQRAVPSQLRTATTAAMLAPDEIQNLAENMGELMTQAAGQDLQFKVHIELGRESRPEETVIENVNQVLAKVSDKLRLS